MAKYELIGADNVVKYISEKYGASKSDVNEAWASQFNFIRKTIAEKTIKCKYYPSFLIPKFGRMYCKPSLLKKFKTIGESNESI